MSEYSELTDMIERIENINAIGFEYDPDADIPKKYRNLFENGDGIALGLEDGAIYITGLDDPSRMNEFEAVMNQVEWGDAITDPVAYLEDLRDSRRNERRKARRQGNFL